MHTVDRALIRAPLERVFAAAASVERWPEILAHYRWVRFLDRSDGGGLVEMAAWRPFGLFRYPTWWVSQMTVDRAAGEIRYRHVRGLTRGMAVVWRLAADPGGVQVTVVHDWAGPAWGPLGALAAWLVIGPVFIHGIASRTLAGIKRAAEHASLVAGSPSEEGGT
jgi:ribosome-associated toxin RatA of RatAB toxin-antitoxin module